MIPRTSAPPVAQGGILAKIGAKNKDIKKQIPVLMAESPVRPPAAIPAPLSIYAVTGELPKRAPTEMQEASVTYAMVERSKSPSASVAPQKRTIE